MPIPCETRYQFSFTEPEAMILERIMRNFVTGNQPFSSHVPGLAFEEHRLAQEILGALVHRSR